MSDPTLIIGRQNTSSWSLRAWLAVKMAGIPCRIEKIRHDLPEGKQALRERTPAGLVPVLRHGDIVVWDSISICEYLAETFPQARLWPQDRHARAAARSVSAEMHSGFPALRGKRPMNICARLSAPPDAGVESDIARIQHIWQDSRERFGSGGPFLFGHFTAADAMFAPVASRFLTYGVMLDPVPAAYRDTMLALPPMQDWRQAAAAEE